MAERPLLSDLTRDELLARAAQFREMAAEAGEDVRAALIRLAVQLEKRAGGTSVANCASASPS